MRTVIVIFISFCFCSAKFAEFDKSISHSRILDPAPCEIPNYRIMQNKCDVCYDYVDYLDNCKIVEEWKVKTPEEFSSRLQNLCPRMSEGTYLNKVCWALKDKFDGFAEAYFEHRADPQVYPAQNVIAILQTCANSVARC